ncbi:MAG: TraM recognition domain-containing protein [Phycisphaerales bacterium]
MIARLLRSRRAEAPPDVLDRSLITFNRSNDRLTWRDVLGGGVSIIADSGSGKSSGVIFPLVRAIHSKRASVVHITVKPDDSAKYRRLAELNGRSDVRVFGIEDRYNPLAFEQSNAPAGTGLVENLTQLVLLPLRRQQRHGGSGDAFWKADAERYVRHLVTIFTLAGEPLSYRLINECLLNLPEDPEDVQCQQWRSSNPAYGALVRAENQPLTPAQRGDLEDAAAFLLRTVPATPSRTRASTVATVTSAIDPYVRGEVGQVINAGHSTWTPDELVAQPGVVILDLPLQSWGEIGGTIQRILVSSIQRAILRRDLKEASHPVVLVMDEYQEFLDPKDDPAFMRTARDRRGCCILATQCVGNIRDACGESRDPQAAAEAILGLPSVKFFGATTDPATLKYASEVFTHTLQPRISFGNSQNSGDSKRPGSGTGRNTNISRELQPDVPHHEFVRLRRGGPGNGWNVDVFCSVSGRIWRASRRPSLKVTFQQIRL